MDVTKSSHAIVHPDYIQYIYIHVYILYIHMYMYYTYYTYIIHICIWLYMYSIYIYIYTICPWLRSWSPLQPRCWKRLIQPGGPPGVSRLLPPRATWIQPSNKGDWVTMDCSSMDNQQLYHGTIKIEWKWDNESILSCVHTIVNGGLCTAGTASPLSATRNAVDFEPNPAHWARHVTASKDSIQHRRGVDQQLQKIYESYRNYPSEWWKLCGCLQN